VGAIRRDRRTDRRVRVSAPATRATAISNRRGDEPNGGLSRSDVARTLGRRLAGRWAQHGTAGVRTPFAASDSGRPGSDHRRRGARGLCLPRSSAHVPQRARRDSGVDGSDHDRRLQQLGSRGPAPSPVGKRAPRRSRRRYVGDGLPTADSKKGVVSGSLDPAQLRAVQRDARGCVRDERAGLAGRVARHPARTRVRALLHASRARLDAQLTPGRTHRGLCGDRCRRGPVSRRVVPSLSRARGVPRVSGGRTSAAVPRRTSTVRRRVGCASVSGEASGRAAGGVRLRAVSR
jgi:hypothetical protein